MIHVLYVDDEEILLDLAKLFLERTGKFVVDTASSAIGLVDSPTTGTYDAIISDYMMPGMNGIDFLKAIRAKYPDMPFILFTGRGREEVVIEAINNGVDFYLQKGGDPKAQFVELGHKVQQAVKRRRAERELYESEQRFSKAFHANPAISGLSELKTGTYIDVNDAFLKRLSFTREEVIGKSSIELNIITPQTRKELLHILEHEGYIHNHQISLRAKTGDVLHVLVSGDIIRSGGTDLLLVQAVDITERIKSQQALFESESRLRSFVEHTAEGIILIDEDGRIIEWNSAAEQILGISKQDALGMLCWELMAQMMPEEKRTINHSEGMKQRIITALKTGVPPSRDPIVIQIIGKDKTVRSIKQTTFPIPTSNGFRFGSIIEDITSQKITEEQYRFIADNSIDVIWTMDLFGRFTYISPSIYHLRGYTPQEVMEQPLEDAVSPKSLVLVQKTLQMAQEEIKQGRLPPPITLEVEQPCKDGSFVWTEVVAKPMLDKMGYPIGFIGISRDITQRKQAEEDLKDNETKFISIFNQTPDPIIIMDSSGIIREVNRGFCQMFNLPDADVVGKAVHEISALAGLPSPQAMMNSIEKTGIFRQEIIFARENAPAIIAELASSQIAIHDKPSLLIQIHDSTDIRKAHDAVRKANNKLNILASITRHDILNRVMIASLYCEELKEQVSDPTVLKYLSTIMQAAADIEHLITFTKEYQDLGTTAPAWQRVESILQSAPILNLAKGVRVVSHMGSLEIYADLMLEKVLYNLVENSVRHGQNLTNIMMSFHKVDQDCILVYEDDGGGVEDSEKEKIFERGFGKNTGMGLFLIREILSITGIEIHERGRFGAGVRFEMRVPADKWRFIDDGKKPLDQKDTDV